METVAYAHIDYTPEGTPIIVDTQTKVEVIVLDHIAWHWDAETIIFKGEGFLILA